MTWRTRRCSWSDAGRCTALGRRAIEELYARPADRSSTRRWRTTTTRAQDWEKALEYLEKAGDKAVGRFRRTRMRWTTIARALEVCDRVGGMPLKAAAADRPRSAGIVNFGIGAADGAGERLCRNVDSRRQARRPAHGRDGAGAGWGACIPGAATRKRGSSACASARHRERWWVHGRKAAASFWLGRNDAYLRQGERSRVRTTKEATRWFRSLRDPFTRWLLVLDGRDGAELGGATTAPRWTSTSSAGDPADGRVMCCHTGCASVERSPWR